MSAHETSTLPHAKSDIIIYFIWYLPLLLQLKLISSAVSSLSLAIPSQVSVRVHGGVQLMAFHAHDQFTLTLTLTKRVLSFHILKCFD